MEKAHGIFDNTLGGFLRPHPEPRSFSGRAGGTGNIRTLGDTYQFAVDVSDFSPEDIIITTSKNQIEVRAEKLSLIVRSSAYPVTVILLWKLTRRSYRSCTFFQASS
ncbi:heat shock protein beta-7 isoform X3 [Crotalus tigris]|uniref:heat shock protein beta-7 isoform X3 n=1 Tax=Crotalus tigris TaxID=88082 RepID=UPI00192FB376|nr:heat shock protein beta-7 isoform X3 [Crotalus tigris]